MTSNCDDDMYNRLIVDALHGGIEPVRSFLRDHNVSADGIFHKCPLLILASSMGHIKLVKWLLNQGANPSLCDEENHTAFFVAAGGGFKDLAILLYEEGGVDVEDVDIYGLTALDWAHEKWASVPTGCEEFEAIKTTIEWLLYQRASPCACAASLRPHMAFQLYPAAASDSSGAPVLASSAAPPGIRSPESALALALASTLNRRIYVSTRFTFSAPRDPDEDSDDSAGSSVDCLEKFRNLRIIIPEGGDEDDSPSVDYEEEEDEEEDALMTLHRFGASRYEHFPSFPPPTD